MTPLVTSQQLFLLLADASKFQQFYYWCTRISPILKSTGKEKQKTDSSTPNNDDNSIGDDDKPKNHLTGKCQLPHDVIPQGYPISPCFKDQFVKRYSFSSNSYSINHIVTS